MSQTLFSKDLVDVDPKEIQQYNSFTKLVHNQKIVQIPELVLESGLVLNNFPIAYKTWGKLNENCDNCLIICHALTGSSDVADWWGPLLGKDKAFDPTRYFIICLNSMGSPYGSFSPLSINESTGRPYGPEFPLCTVRDDVRAHKMVLDSLGVQSIACVVGGSMGGMLALEWTTMFNKSYVRNLVALATSARHSAWCISWSEAQRQSIYSDPKYLDGFYSLEDPPIAGLSAARMAALLTYRSRNSFEKKFSRRQPSKQQENKSKTNEGSNVSNSNITEINKQPFTINERSLHIHNDGMRNYGNSLSGNIIRGGRTGSVVSTQSNESQPSSNVSSSDSLHSVSSVSSISGEVKDLKPAQTYFSAQSYLRYQGTKFVNRFDANCYIAITRKLDTHDLARDRSVNGYEEDMEKILESIEQPTLVIGISSDGLFTYSEQEFLAEHIPNANLEKIESPEGHDAFLLEFELINKLMVQFMKKNIPNIMNAKPLIGENDEDLDTIYPRDSVFGEAEEVTNW